MEALGPTPGAAAAVLHSGITIRTIPNSQIETTATTGDVDNLDKVVSKGEEEEGRICVLAQWVQVFSLNPECTQTIGAGSTQINVLVLKEMLDGQGKIRSVPLHSCRLRLKLTEGARSRERHKRDRRFRSRNSRTWAWGPLFVLLCTTN